MLNDEIDAKFGFERCKDRVRLVGWLINMHPVSFGQLAYVHTVKSRYIEVQGTAG